MKCAILCFALFAIVSTSTAAWSTENALIEKVKCVVGTMDKLSSEFKIDPLWQDIQAKMLKNINNLFLCLKLSGFSLQR